MIHCSRSMNTSLCLRHTCSTAALQSMSPVFSVFTVNSQIFTTHVCSRLWQHCIVCQLNCANNSLHHFHSFNPATRRQSSEEADHSSPTVEIKTSWSWSGSCFWCNTLQQGEFLKDGRWWPCRIYDLNTWYTQTHPIIGALILLLIFNPAPWWILLVLEKCCCLTKLWCQSLVQWPRLLSQPH